MKKRILLFLTVSACALMAASVDGKWVAEQKMERNGNEITMTTTFDLKADGSTLTGTVATGAGERSRTSTVENGKVNGNRISFTTKQQMRNREFEVKWDGTVEGDQLKLTRSGARGRDMELVAKRQ